MSRPAAIAWSLMLCLVSAAAVAAAAWFFVLTSRGQRFDSLTLAGGAAHRDLLPETVEQAVNTISLPVLAVAAAIAVLIALVRRQMWRALVAVIVVAGSNLTTQVIKAALARPDLHLGLEDTPNSFPSGHTTAAASIVLVLLLAAPDALRLLAALLVTVVPPIIGVGTVLESWHRPSDLVGAILVTSTWAFLALTIEHACAEPSRSGTDDGREHGPFAQWSVILPWVIAAAAGVVAVLCAAGLPRPFDLGSASQQNAALVGSAAALVALSGVLAGATSAALDRSRRPRPS